MRDPSPAAGSTERRRRALSLVGDRVIRGSLVPRDATRLTLMRQTPFAQRVLRVVLRGPQEQVVRIHTAPRVAPMTDQEAIR